jgi:hypothetical protein
LQVKWALEYDKKVIVIKPLEENFSFPETFWERPRYTEGEQKKLIADLTNVRALNYTQRDPGEHGCVPAAVHAQLADDPNTTTRVLHA